MKQSNNTNTYSCNKCNITKPLKEYHKKQSSNNGHSKICKVCRNNHHKEYRKANKEKISEYNRTYELENKEVLAKKKKIYTAKTKEARQKYHRKYNRTDKGRLVKRNSEQKRRAIIKSSRIDTQLLEKLTTLKICYWCNRKLTKFHIDHYQPLSNGGLHSLENLVISCPTCNLKKSKKDPIKFANSIGKLL